MKYYLSYDACERRHPEKTRFSRLFTLGHILLFYSFLLAWPGIRKISSLNAGEEVWTPIGPSGVNVQDIQVSRSDTNVLYLGTLSSGIFKSTDNGQNWTRLPIIDIDTYAIAVDPNDDNIVYVGTYIGGILKSKNGGYNWLFSNTGLFDPFVFALVIDPQESQILYAGTFRGSFYGKVYKSTDSGTTWQPTNNGMSDDDVLSLAINPVNTDIVYAGTYGGVHGLYKSQDGGKNWILANNGLTNKNVFAIAVDPLCPDTVYAATGGGGVFISMNGGEDWVAINSGITNKNIYDLVINPLNSQVLYAATMSGLFKTTDCGNNWKSIHSGLRNSMIATLTINPDNPDNIFAGALGSTGVKSTAWGTFLGGVFKSDDGGEYWRESSMGLIDLNIRSIVSTSSDSNTLYVGTFGNGVFQSTDQGKTWNAIKTNINLGLTDPDVLAITVHHDNPDTILAGTYTKGIYKSVNGGINWTLVFSVPRVQSLGFHPTDRKTIFAGTFADGFLKSTDCGETWHTTGLVAPEIFTFIFHPIHPETLYAASSSSEGGIFRSFDGGNSWEAVNTGLTIRSVRALAIDPNNPEILYAGTLRKSSADMPFIFKTIDGGELWIPTSNASFETIDLIISPINSNVLFNGNIDDGVLKTTNGGIDWFPFKDGLKNTFVMDLCINSKQGNILYAGTEGGGVFEITVIDTSTHVGNKKRIQQKFNLSQNYPNPFNASTCIDYVLKIKSKVILKVYDTLGREVVTLINKDQEEGKYRIIFDGNHLVSGIYLYRLSTSDYNSVKKMILIK